MARVDIHADGSVSVDGHRTHPGVWPLVVDAYAGHEVQASLPAGVTDVGNEAFHVVRLPSGEWTCNGAPLLFEYVREPETRRPIGCVVALDAQHIGWSQCHFAPKEKGKISLGDKWNKVKAVERAVERARRAGPIDPALANIHNRAGFNSLSHYIFRTIEEGAYPTARKQQLFLNKINRISNRIVDRRNKAFAETRLRDQVAGILHFAEHQG